MSYVVKGFDIEQCCYWCPHLDDSGDYDTCRITGISQGFKFNSRDTKMKSCPLIKLPKQHGDLIDRQALLKTLQKHWNVEGDDDFANKSVWREIENAPTVIEAEDGE